MLDDTERRKADKATRRREAEQRARIGLRHRRTDWPLDAETLQPAEWIEPGDVCMPQPPDPPPLSEYRKQAIAAAAAATPTEIEAGKTLVIARHHERERERAREAALRGPVWTVDVVDRRIARAFEVSLTWSKGGPRAYGSMMPRAITQLSDLVAQAENQELKKHLSRLLRRRVQWSAKDEALAAEAIGWTADYLCGIDDPAIPLFVNAGGWWRALRVKVRTGCDQIGIWPATYYRKRRIGLELIVDGLTADRKAPL